MSRRILVSAALVAAVWIVQGTYDLQAQPDVSASAAVNALNGGSSEALAVRNEHAAHNVVPVTALSLTLLAALACFAPRRRRALSPWRR